MSKREQADLIWDSLFIQVRRSRTCYRQVSSVLSVAAHEVLHSTAEVADLGGVQGRVDHTGR
eukprot:28116-Eustigmatos_ZCMA.PRE.1